MTSTFNPVQSREDVPRLEWDEFYQSFSWKQGDHVALIGPTYSGKTTLALEILPLRKYIVVFATKPKDSTLERFAEEKKFRIIREWTNLSVKRYPRRVLWPDARRLDSDLTQEKTFRDAMARIYRQGGWCVYGDELWYLANQLGLDHEIRMFFTQARSLGISFVCSTQRPSRVPLELYDQSTHLFFWRDNDERNLSRISGIAYQSSRMIMDLVANLEHHEVLYINTRDGNMIRTMAPAPKGGKK